MGYDIEIRRKGHERHGQGRQCGEKVPVAVLHPSQTFGEPGRRSNGYRRSCRRLCGLGKLTTDKSVARIVSEAVVGKSATDALAGTTEDMKELKDKAGETVSPGEAVGGADETEQGIELPAGSLRRWVVQHAQRLLRNLGGAMCRD